MQNLHPSSANYTFSSSPPIKSRFRYWHWCCLVRMVPCVAAMSVDIAYVAVGIVVVSDVGFGIFGMLWSVMPVGQCISVPCYYRYEVADASICFLSNYLSLSVLLRRVSSFTGFPHTYITPLPCKAPWPTSACTPPTLERQPTRKDQRPGRNTSGKSMSDGSVISQ